MNGDHPPPTKFERFADCPCFGLWKGVRYVDNEQSGETLVPFNVLSDTYRVFVPIEDTDIMKSIEVDANGDYIVQGVMSSDDKDEEDDSITPDGMDCSYFLTKGWVKYEHGNNPNQFIGEPLEVKVGRFEHPTLRKSVSGIFVKARLFQQRELTQQAVRTIEDLQKSNTKRRMGWSIEGNVKERCRTTGKILKSILRNVVLTMNPVNTTTWAELSKSFAKNHEVEINMVEKSMDMAGMAEVMSQSVEGGTKPVDGDEWVSKLFRKYAKHNVLNRKLRKSFISSDPATVGMTAYQYGRREGLGYDEALEFASAVAERFDVLKSLFGKIGGEKMSKQTQSTLAGLLDTELEELQKSLEVDEELEGEELIKAQKEDKKDDDDQDDADDDADDEDADEDDSDDADEDADEDDKDEDEDEKGGLKKSHATEFAKSFGAQEDNGQAMEVSDFLSNLVDEMGFHFDGFNKSMTHVAKQQNATVQALMGMGELMKSMATELNEVKADNAELQKSLSDLLQRPVGRRSVTNQREVQTLTKSLGAGGGASTVALTRRVVLEALNKSFDAGNMSIGTEISRFEAGVPLDQLRLPADVKQTLGL